MPSASSDNQSERSLRAVCHDLLLSGVAGTMCRVPTHPLDTCKTVAFASDSECASTLGAAKRIWAREGMRGFYRGVGITALAACPGNALYFVSYEYARDTTAPLTSQWSYVVKPFIHLGCGFFAEAVSCVVWVPVDVIKERLQSQGPSVEGRYRNSLHGFMTCLRHERLRGLYKGYFSTLASFGPFSAVYFACFELMNAWLAPLKMDAFAQGLVAAFLGNTMSACITNPLELVKTRLQIQHPVLESQRGTFAYTRVHGYKYSSFIGGLREIVKIHGFSGLWRGAAARAAHTGPNAALTMGTYKWLQDKYPYREKSAQ